MTAIVIGTGLQVALAPVSSTSVQAAALLASSLAQATMSAFYDGSQVGMGSVNVSADGAGNLTVSEYDLVLTGALPKTGGELRILSNGAGFTQPIDGVDLVMPSDLNTGDHLVGPALIFVVQASA